MKAILILIFLVGGSAYLQAQNNLEAVLAEIEKNNTTLSAVRLNADADKIGHKTGLLPQNPELEFDYLWGNPSDIGNRTDFSLRQSFDFPTAYMYKNQISDLKNTQSELEFQKQRKAVLHDARRVCIELIYQNALKAELAKRLANARQMAQAYQRKFELGEASIMAYNKAQLTLVNIAQAAETNAMEQQALILELAKLNGGIPINLTDSVFAAQMIPTNFDDWYAQAEQNNPVLQWLAQELVVSQKEKQLTTASNFPKFYAGYMSEKVVGEQFRGITMGLSIPLWENKYTLKYAQAKTLAIQGLQTDAKQQFYNQMKALHSKVVVLQKNLSAFQQNLALYSNTSYVQKAFDKGEISLSEYLLELSVYYESFDKLLAMEREMNLAVAELKQFME